MSFLFMCCVFLFKVRLIRTVMIVLFFMQTILDTTYYYISLHVMLCRQVLSISVSIHVRQKWNNKILQNIQTSERCWSGLYIRNT